MITNLKNSPINYAYRNENKPNTLPSFKGLEAPIVAYRFLNNSPAIGACAVDLGFMVVPRTATDIKKRGIDAGAETGLRESAAAGNHAAVGAVGMAAGALVSKAINDKYNIKANKIFANNESIDFFSNVWEESGNDINSYYSKILSKLQGFNEKEVVNSTGEAASKQILRWQNLSTEVQSDLVKILSENTLNADELPRDLKKNIISRVTYDTGAEGTFRLKSSVSGVTKDISDSLDVMIGTMTEMGRAFVKKNEGSLEDFVKGLKHTKLRTAVVGLGISTLIGCSVQPLNRYLTKKRTGKDGFVGVEGREPDKSNGFKASKIVSALAMVGVSFFSIGKKPQEILNKIQFTQKLPNISQFKLLYGFTVASRFLAARDKNELREGIIKDSLGFLNWLILGDVATKLVAKAVGKNGELINNTVAKSDKKGIMQAIGRIINIKVKSYDEVLLEGISKAEKTMADPAKRTIETMLKEGKKLKFADMWKYADRASKIKVGKLALAQTVGYVYSGLALGIGIARLNIFVTNKIQKKQKAQQTPDKQNADVKFFAQQNLDKKSIFSKIDK